MSAAEIEFNISLQPKQRELWKAVELSPALWVGYGGARGGGKSDGGRSVVLKRRFDYAKTDALIMRRTYQELYKNHILPMFRRWPITRRWYHNESHTLRLPNGSNVVFGYAEHKGDIYKFQGQEYADILIEEATHFNEEEMRFLETCNRWTGDTAIVPKMICTMNPGGVGHEFIKRIFVDEEHQDNERAADYTFLQAYGWDNVEWSRVALLEDAGLDPRAFSKLPPVEQSTIMRPLAKLYYSWSDKQRFEYFVTRSNYGRKLWGLSDDLRNAHLFGEWDQFVGQFFVEWRKSVHVCRPFRIPTYWQRFRSFDWGFTSPACMLWHAVSPEGRVFTYRELYVARKDTAWLAKKVVEMTAGEEIGFTAGDPACWDASRGPSIADEMAKHGVAMVKADNDRVNGWSQMRSYLAWEMDPETGILTREPMWQIFEGKADSATGYAKIGCPHLIRTLPGLVHDAHDPEDVDTDGEDHAPDTARYGLMTRPKISTIPVEAMAHEYAEATRRAEHLELSARRHGQQMPMD